MKNSMLVITNCGGKKLIRSTYYLHLHRLLYDSYYIISAICLPHLKFESELKLCYNISTVKGEETKAKPAFCLRK